MHSSVYALAMTALRRYWPYYSSALILIILIFIRHLSKRLIFVRELSAIPGPSGIPILGNSLSLTGGQDDFFRLLLKCAKEYGSVFKLWVGMRPFVFLSAAEDVQPILSSNLHIDKSYEYDFLRPWVGTGLLTSTGSKWHARRKLLTPSFHYSILEEFVEPIIRQSQILVRRLEKNSDGPAFDVMAYTKLCALDIICVTAMGKQLHAQETEDNDYVKAVDGINEILQRRFITPWLKPELLFKFTSMGKRQEDFVKTINNFVNGVIRDKKAELKEKKISDSEEMKKRKRRTFIDLILETAEEGDVLTDEDVREEVNTFMFAGHDTTSVAIGWCLYVLGKHKEVQEKIIREYDDVVRNEIPTLKEIQNLEYLERCIKETMRLYPVVPLIARDIKHKVELRENKTLLPGVTALIFTPSLHRDARYFPDPDEFRPDRFLQEQNDQRNPFAYIPFSAGPRNCIGAKFAMMEVKLVLNAILKRYEVTSVDSEHELNLFSELVLSNKQGIRITITKRKS